MYEHYFGLRERPFDLTPNPKYLVLTDPHREVLSNLQYAITSRKGVTLVLGEPGSGKTTLIRTVLQQQPQQVHRVHLSNPTLSREEFSQILATKFRLSERAVSSKAFMLEELEALLAMRHEQNEVTVLIVDEAQSAPDHVLEEIRLLANIETDDQKLVSVILAGQPELAGRLDQPNLRQLKQRVALRCELRSLTLPETTNYVAARIVAAGGIAAQVFTREAVTIIHQAAAGLPRTVNVIADNALLGGFAAGQKPVQSNIVWDVCRDLGMGSVRARADSMSRRSTDSSENATSVAEGSSRGGTRPPESSDSRRATAPLAQTKSVEPPGEAVTATQEPEAAPAKSGWRMPFNGRRRHIGLFGN